MTELRDPNPAMSTPSSGDPNDPLHNLYRMSRTAGLGSGDYVAISNTAIVALLLGFASLLALLWPVALLIALAAVVCGILAVVQIRGSNGTQTGLIFAVIGVLLGIGITGVTGGKIAIGGVEHKKDEAAIDQLVTRLNELVVAKQYPQAYQTLFSDGFKQNFNESEFARRWEAHTPIMGDVQQIGWGKRAEIDKIRGTGEKRAIASSTVKFSKYTEVATQSITFQYHDGEWVIDGIAQIFDPPKAAGDDGSSGSPNPLDPQGPVFQIPGAQGAGGPG